MAPNVKISKSGTSRYVSGKVHAHVINLKLEHYPLPQNTAAATAQSEGSAAALSSQDNNTSASSGTPFLAASQDSSRLALMQAEPSNSDIYTHPTAPNTTLTSVGSLDSEILYHL